MSEAAPGWQSCALAFAPDHPVAAGHFPGNPIVPGALLLAQVLRAVDTRGATVRQAKFFAPVRPGETVDLRWRPAPDGGLVFEAEVAARLVMSGVLGKAEA